MLQISLEQSEVLDVWSKMERLPKGKVIKMVSCQTSLFPMVYIGIHRLELSASNLVPRVSIVALIDKETWERG